MRGAMRVLAWVSACVTLIAGCGSDTSRSQTSVTHAAASPVQAVVAAASEFLGMLDDTQKNQAQLDLTRDTATSWSNLPCGQPCRGGVAFSSLTDEQLAAAKQTLQAAMGTGSGVGYDQAMQILLADDYLKSLNIERPTTPLPGGFARVGYSSGEFYLAVLGQPSMTGSWQLHFGGHHLAVNITYRDGQTVGATPFFIGVEPLSWKDGGTTFAPMDIMREGMVELASSLTPAQLAKAKLPQAYTNVLLGPGLDGGFPQVKQGLKGSELSSEQKQLLIAAIRPWVAVVDDHSAAALMVEYEKQFDDTYIGHSGGTSFTILGDYLRVDGPAVWVEFVSHNLIALADTIHYHTVYRDRVRDYGGEFKF